MIVIKIRAHILDRETCKVCVFMCDMLRLFRAMSKPRPGDQPLLIIFVIGGVSSTEVRQVRDVVAAAKTNIQVM